MNELKICDNFSRIKTVKSQLIRDSQIDYQPLVSICIPTYKRASSLKETILSAMHQIDFDSFNIIIVDNNPEREDETEELVSSISEPKLKYYKNDTNLGMFGNHNRAVELSDGTYTLFIHDDDLLLPDYLKVAVGILENNKSIDFLFTGNHRWEKTVNGEFPSIVERRSLKTRKLRIDDFIYKNGFPPSGMIFRTSKMISIGGYNDSYYPSSDYYFNVLAVLNSNVFYLQDKLYVYCIGINESLNPRTVLSWLEKDYELNEWMKREFLVCRFFYPYFKKNYSINHLKNLVGVDESLVNNAVSKRYLDVIPYNEWINRLYYYVYIIYGYIFKR